MGWLIVMKGGPGSGKSTVAKDLSRRLRLPLIDKDDIRDILDGPGVKQGSVAGAVSYEIMLRVAARQLQQGLDVVCDSPLHKETYENAIEVAEETGSRLVVVECICSDEDVWRKRIEERQARDTPDHITTTWNGVEEFYEDPEKSKYEIDADHGVFDTVKPTDEVMAEALAWLRELGFGTERERAATLGGHRGSVGS